MAAIEINFDALVGPTHNYAGLAHGNLASRRHGSSISNPKAAAMEGLAKMKLLMDLGVKQGVLPPQHRPDIGALRRLGFSGSDSDILKAAYRADPVLLAACSSASAMWAANAATVSASADTTDGRVHFTPANLVSQFHRSLEAQSTATVLQAIFPDRARFAHHPPLPAAMQFGDEGAANHTRLAMSHDGPGIGLFVYGRAAFEADAAAPAIYPARQTREASMAVARLHQLHQGAAMFLQQNPAAIDAGVFHNDVICVGHLNVLLCHEVAFIDTAASIAHLHESFERRCGGRLHVILAGQHVFPIDQAVRSYLFNSQIVSLPDGSMTLIAPRESAETDAARRFIDTILAADNPIRSVHYVDIRQSMRNGGGPACLRLRVPLNDAELAAVHPGVILTPKLHARLVSWVEHHYREQLAPEDLADVRLLDESRQALDELAEILGI